MDIVKTIEIVISVFGLFLGGIYFIGGVIVNLHLSHYGIEKYQILKAKYLAVGTNYFINLVAILILAFVSAYFLLFVNQVFQTILLVVSIAGSVVLIALWGTPNGKNKIFFSYGFWALLGVVISIFPLLGLMKLGFALFFGGIIDLDLTLLGAKAVFAGLLSFFGLIFYFARHIYAKPLKIFGVPDRLGMGIPISVQLAGEVKNISQLECIGVPVKNSESTCNVLMIDETDTHYIIGITVGSKVHAVEINKDIISAVRIIND